MDTAATSSEKVEIPVRAMISLVRFGIGVLIRVPGGIPPPVQLLQAVFLLLCDFGQLLGLHLQLENGRRRFWRRCGQQRWKRRPHMNFHCITLPASFMAVTNTLGSIRTITVEQEAGQITLMISLMNLMRALGSMGCYFRWEKSAATVE